EKRGTRKTNRILGIHAVYEALAAGRPPIERLHVAREVHSGRLKEIMEMAQDRGIPVRKEARSVLDAMANGSVHQGLIAIAAEVQYGDFEDLFKAAKPLIVVLDGVEDPHNLGAVMRTAEACGATGIVVPERHSATLSATTVRASAGASAY